MSGIYLFEKVNDLKDKFKRFFVSKKKLKALENYSECAPFEHKDYLNLIKRCMNNGFVGEPEADFLSYMIDKYEVRFLDWAHKTKWLKNQMQHMKSKNFKPQMEHPTFFDLMKEKQQNLGMHIPLEVLASQRNRQKGVSL